MLAGIPALRRCDVPSHQTGVAITECQQLPILQQQYLMVVRRLCDVFQVRAYGIFLGSAEALTRAY